MFDHSLRRWINPDFLYRLRQRRRAEQTLRCLLRLPARVISELLRHLDRQAPSVGVLDLAEGFSSPKSEWLATVGADRLQPVSFRAAPADLRGDQ